MRLLQNELRMKLLWELARFPQGLSVSSLVERLHEQQYNVSHELAKGGLLEAGLVEGGGHRRKKNQIYRLSAMVRVTIERDTIMLQVTCWNGQSWSVQSTHLTSAVI